MSGIFGFTYHDPQQSQVSDALDGLSYWNQLYGRLASSGCLFGRSGIGCHVEHFTERFPFGGPILAFGGCHAVVDALLFNRDELLASLTLPADSALSDEELLLRLIREKGFDALSSVNGDFAGAIFDPEKEEWILFRDHMGVRPLYYYQQDDLFAFSTDLRGILSIPVVDNRINHMLLYKDLIAVSRLTMTETNYEKIRCIHPGSVCTVRRTRKGFQRKEHRFWRIRSKKIRLPSDEDYRRELRRLVTDAVNCRCDAIDGLLGAELSGGLDSSIIDILINRHGREAVYYSWSPDSCHLEIQEGDDERKVIEDICAQENIRCRYLRQEDMFDLTHSLKEAMPPYINAPHLSFGGNWMKQQGANVVFSGHGGDEGVSHRAARLELLYHGELRSYFKIYWNNTKGRSLRPLRTLAQGLIDAHTKWRSLHKRPTHEQMRPGFLKAAFCERMAREMVFRPLPFCYDPSKYIRWGGTRSRLDNAAFYGSYSGVRFLFPYVDHRVMDFAVSIPRRLHVNEHTNRAIFRETFADLMPPSLRDVQYKDMPSSRNSDMIAIGYDLLRINIEKLLERLDPDIWSDVADWDGIRALLQIEITDEITSFKLQILINHLNSMLLIQNAMKESRRWRERNE